MSSFDYIVIGAGSAGAVVAGRLSEDPSNRVLLLEAGGSNRHMSVQTPVAFAKQFKTELDWEFYTEPEPNLYGRSLYHPRARMLGGCSSMNAMIYMRGNQSDFDGWAKGGATGWSYDEVLPLFKRTENNARGGSEYHGVGGPMYVEELRSPNPVSEKILEAMVATGIPATRDFNGPDQVGAGLPQTTIHNGKRWSTAEAFVAPAKKRANFTLMTNAHVERVRIEGGRAVGVDVERDGRRETLRAEREVIVSAGAFNTPQILMLSGIGPADHLAEHDITAVIDNPNVGAHLMDHPMFIANFETTAKGTLAEAESPIQLAKFLATGRGLLTSNVAEAVAMVHTRDGDAPDQQLLGGPGFFMNNGFTTHTRPAYLLAASLIGSRSRGNVRLRSANPKDHVAATFNYFDDPADMDSMVAAIALIREIASCDPLRSITGIEINPGAGRTARKDVEAAIRREVEHTYHPSCTARIGTEEDGVVDPQLRVHGIAGLRVADTSVFPTITSGNTHAPSMMAGEKLAQMIREGL